jgi:4-amino-4-deoxy-L-arabinose transferase-like glycosyltransferase
VSPAPRSSDVNRWWALYLVAVATFLPAIGFHYVGEEAIFPISSLEMWHHGEWIEQLFYGSSLKHNPLFNWMIIPLASLAGWEHMLAVTRALTIAATAGTGLVVAWLCKALYRDSAFAAFAAVVYLTLADVFFYRGWLAYADPLFAFFVTAAIAALWIACLRQSIGLLALAVAALTCAFMTKALTAYAFYAGAVLVLLAEVRYRAFLLRPASWMVHAAGAVGVLAWLYSLPQNTGQGGRMFAEIVAKLAPESLAEYLVKLVAYPVNTLLHIGPLAFVAVYFFWKERRAAVENGAHVRTAMTIALIGYLPYWLAPQSSMRYLLPLYPLVAVALARFLWTLGGAMTARRWILGIIAVKVVAVLVAFPYYQSRYRGENFEAAAQDIVRRTAGQPLYTNNVSASGMSVTAHMDILRLPAAPLTFAPSRWETGFIMAYTPDPELGRVAKEYRLGGNTLYLLCRGVACGEVRP